nr:hypothetical protein [Tanacetum cinerariifolium]
MRVGKGKWVCLRWSINRRGGNECRDVVRGMRKMGAESRRNVPEWLLRITNDRVDWNKYPWGLYVWPTLYSQLRNANVRRWGPLYIDQPTNEDDPTTYLIFGYTLAFKADFVGFIDQVERVPFDLSRQNMYEISSDIYRQFVEQKIKLERNRKDVDDIKEEMLKFRKEMNARPVRQENTVPINVGQHYGFSDFSQFQSMQRVSKTKNKGKKANLSPLNLGGVLEGYNEEENNVTLLGSQFTANTLFYENVDPAK